MSLKQTQGKKNGTDYSSPAVNKAVDVIEFLASQVQGVSITAISDGLGRSVGEIYRVVRALESRRLVYKDLTTDKFQLSLRLFELAHKYPPIERLTRVAFAEMDLLCKRTLQSCHLAVAEFPDIKIVAAQESPLPMHYSVRIGSSFEMSETSSGMVIAAYSTEAQRKYILKMSKPANRQKLLARFEKITHNGYEINDSEVVTGLINIAVPVHSHEGKILASLTTPYLHQSKASVQPEAILQMQIAASHRMRQSLG